MILKEIVLGKTEESKRDAIQKYSGRQVILNDAHENWAHGVLLKDRHDSKAYQMKIADGRRERQLRYYDLNQLMVVSNLPEYLTIFDFSFLKRGFKFLYKPRC